MENVKKSKISSMFRAQGAKDSFHGKPMQWKKKRTNEEETKNEKKKKGAYIMKKRSKRIDGK